MKALFLSAALLLMATCAYAQVYYPHERRSTIYQEIADLKIAVKNLETEIEELRIELHKTTPDITDAQIYHVQILVPKSN